MLVVPRESRAVERREVERRSHHEEEEEEEVQVHQIKPCVLWVRIIKGVMA